MSRRFVSIWFRYLRTDWFVRRQHIQGEVPFVLASPDHGRMIVTAANSIAEEQGVETRMVVADARVLIPFLKVFDDKPGISDKLLTRLAEWCIRYTPSVAVDPPDGLILDVTGCTHLWGSERNYLENITTRLKKLGYNNRLAIADTVGCAWAISHFGEHSYIVKSGEQTTALLSLPPTALRLNENIVERLHKLGLKRIRDFIGMPRSSLRRRFGPEFLEKIDLALGYQEEKIQPVHPIEPYHERLPCLEPIITATGIEIALQRMLETLCDRLQQEQKGIRAAVFKCYRIDGKIEKVEIGTNRATHNTKHIFKLFEIKLPTIEPALGIELFTLEAPKVEDVSPSQEKLWDKTCGLDNVALSELLDRLSGKMGANLIHRYLPDEHYWPERSTKLALSLQEKATAKWRTDRPRPLQLLSNPEPVEVTAPIPDYPPMLFRYKGKLHKVIKADGPERIEQEWWIQDGQHRDYYYVEDEQGCRYWLFRSGHYTDRSYSWFIHGFFA
ncbi:MAG TPA: DNA polymerase Y family protein [Chitinophagaceae bacterium]|nr:DNA polymerase Y family protein [Chitinophagaceae bacterium]